MQPVTVKSRLDPDTYYHICRSIYLGPRLYITAVLMLVLMNAVTFWNTPLSWTAECFFIGVIIFWLGIVSPLRLRYSSKRAIKKILSPPYDVTYIIDSEKISSETGENSSEITWKYIKKTIEKPDYFLLKSGPSAFRYLPKKGFASDSDILTFKEIVREQGIKAFFINN